jgi:L-iditol 2-dehydrogenase
MRDLPEALRYAKDRVEDAIKVVVRNKHMSAQRKAIAAEWFSGKRSRDRR